MKVLLHMCCGPCSTYPVELFNQKGIEFEVFFYNPNIHPIEEYEKRKENAFKLSEIKSFKINYLHEFSQNEWENYTGSDESRCRMCYAVRLEKSAMYARDNGFDFFTTSLLVSPYQQHDLIKELGEKFAKKYDINFYYEDIRPNFREGQQIAKDLELYRQKFCGCIVSYNEAQERKNKKKS